MKGRARQFLSKFYAFDCAGTPTKRINLHKMQSAEDRVSLYLSQSRPSVAQQIQTPTQKMTSHLTLEQAELHAVETGYYKTLHGQVDLFTAKALIYRYAMSTPMDPSVRASRESLAAYMPLYDDPVRLLYLPSHLASLSKRTVILPPQFESRNKADRKKLLALM